MTASMGGMKMEMELEKVISSTWAKAQDELRWNVGHPLFSYVWIFYDPHAGEFFAHPCGGCECVRGCREVYMSSPRDIGKNPPEKFRRAMEEILEEVPP